MSEQRMQPGRELDALIAEKVMGYQTAFDEITGDYFFLDDHGDILGKRVPDYSTNPNDAEFVIYHINAAMMPVVIEYYGTGVVARIMRYQHEPRPHWYQRHAAEAKTAPHAICLVTLEYWTGCELEEQL
jgi:hypothetical protein